MYALFTEGQRRTAVDMMAARIDAVLHAFGLRRAGEIRAEEHQPFDVIDQELVLIIPIRRRQD